MMIRYTLLHGMHFTLLFGVLCITLACQTANTGNEEDTEVILAEVYDQKLKLTDITPLLINTTSAEDSASQVRNYVETWVREALLLHEAEQNLPVDVNVNKLVQDYRESLLISNYENVLVNTLLDTVVTESELRSYYEKNKNQYQLEAPILRCHYIKLRKSAPEKTLFQKLWQSELPDDQTALVIYCQKYASDYLLQDSTWYRQPEIERLLPLGVLAKQNLSPGRVLKFTDSEYEYHLRIMQRYQSREIAPLSYVGEQARRYILHKRKIELLEKIKADIYTREIDGGNVKIYI
jgi:hypothetical protein